MRDINIEVKNTLSGLNCRVVYQYPDDFAALPAVSYYTLTEGVSMTADNAELIQEGHIQLDIWGVTMKECSDIAISVDTLMSRGGWAREFSRDLKKECDERVYHKTMRYKKLFMPL